LTQALVEVLGALTPITIPVSRYRVEAFVGWVEGTPVFVPQESEVLRILLADPDTLSREGPRAFVERTTNGSPARFPAYEVDGEKVWGATALILSEFIQIWRETPRS
jgi:hypothetical protein